ncbi:MAG: cysteine hydrolase family protein [Bacteroidetes bacterium]|nr:cysteine hydrolase family protein [Bacteroidota bacterium]
MKKHIVKIVWAWVIFLAFVIAGNPAFSQKISVKNDTLPTALLVIDIQEFYFPGGKLPLENPEAASGKAAIVLKLFRDQKLPVIHIQHYGGSPIHADVAPLPGEKVITKQEANAFDRTDLLETLKSLHVKRLVLCGMQTHMCLEAATRAAYDNGYKCIVVEDACATRALKWGDRTVSAADVHASTLASLDRFYAKVVNAADLQP